MLNFTRFTSKFIAVSLLTGNAFAQQPATPEAQKNMDRLKIEQKATGLEQLINLHPSPAKITPPAPRQAGELCNCWIDRDTTWSVVPFDCAGGSGGPGIAPEFRNDDWSACLGLPFNFCFYGQQMDSLFINNNGNVSFGTNYATFSPIGFPNNSFSMIAPLWSDVDTRGPSSGLVYYKLTSQHLIVHWEAVDYFWSDTLNPDPHLSLYNTYQLIMTNGSDPILPSGQNVSFCYKDMNWTTGDASGGVDGFGGDPATCGVNQGNGVDYFQFGFYDSPTNDWDGPYGNNDGIYSLSNQSFIFNVCDSANTPPIAVANYVCDTLVLCEGDTGFVQAGYLSPEINQVTSIVMDTIGLQGATILSDTMANLAGIEIQIVAQAGNYGYHLLHLYATDNGTPPQTTTSYIVISILNCGVNVNELDAGGALKVSPNPVSEILSVDYSAEVSSEMNLEIRNAIGQVVKTIPLNSGSGFSQQISVHDLSAGIYFLQLQSSGNTITRRFVKQ